MSVPATVFNNIIKLPLDVLGGTNVKVVLPDEECVLSPAEWLESVGKSLLRCALTPQKTAEFRCVIREGWR